MTTHSTDGRPRAKLSELKPGDRVLCDDGFTCGMNGKTLVVEQSEKGLLVPCNQGGHLLEGQLSEENWDSLVGMWRVE